MRRLLPRHDVGAFAGNLILAANPQVVSTTLVAEDYVGNACLTASACHEDADGDGCGGGYGSGSDSGSGCDCSAAASHGPTPIAVALGLIIAGGAALRRRQRSADLR